MTVWAIVVAAGSGARFGGPKQYEALGDRRVLDWSLAAVRSVADGVVVVVAPDRVAQGEPAADLVVAGGSTRSESVRAALAVVPAAVDVIVVHDAARPFAPVSLFESVVAAVTAGSAGAVPGLAVADTVKRTRDGVVVATLDRSELVAVQTPQAFAAAALRQAHTAGEEATDDAALVEAGGGQVAVVPGDPANLKITTRADLDWARHQPGVGAVTTRIGHGFDVHPFSDDPARQLVLGGVAFDGSPGLAGHSDADVVAHAVADALLGAAGLGDLGSHFPDTDPAWAGADSLVLLGQVVSLLAGAGWTPANVDCTVVLEAPKLAPGREAMQEGLSRAVGAPVSVKATRAEGLGALGRGEGVACWAVALIEGR